MPTNENDELIYNWSNSLRQNRDGERFVAAQAAEGLKARGFTPEEALDVMIADAHDVSVAEAAVNTAFAEALPPAAQRAAQASVAPTGYADVMTQVENVLSRTSAKEFVDGLACSGAPLVRVSAKALESWYRLAAMAQQDRNSLGMLHKELRPWFEEAMLNSVLLSERMASSVSGDGTRFAMVTDKGQIGVDLAEGTCTCDRFASGNFGTFGLACEHIVKMADEVSPHQRLMRDIA